jgi:hypothetical protein
MCEGRAGLIGMHSWGFVWVHENNNCLGYQMRRMGIVFENSGATSTDGWTSCSDGAQAQYFCQAGTFVDLTWIAWNE